MSKIILKDKTEIETVALPSIGEIRTNVADLTAAAALKEQLTADNISEVVTTNDTGLEVGHYTDLVLGGMTADLLTAEGIDVKISLREKTDVEKLREEMLASQAVQDGAITDLGETMSEVVEGGAE